MCWITWPLSPLENKVSRINTTSFIALCHIIKVASYVGTYRVMMQVSTYIDTLNMQTVNLLLA